MIKFENTEVFGWGAAIRGMRNPMNSWHLGDTDWFDVSDDRAAESNHWLDSANNEALILGDNDLDLMKRLRNAGTDHRKFMRMITVYVDITAPLYWWKEFDTYKVGTVANSCSTMHKIASRKFIIDDFSHEHLMSGGTYILNCTVDMLNEYRAQYLETKDKKYWWQMIQLLPSFYNQKRTVMMNYEVLANIYKSRRNHKLDEWAEHTESTCPVNENTICSNQKEFLLCEECQVGKGFCDWIKTLPYSELITGEDE